MMKDDGKSKSKQSGLKVDPTTTMEVLKTSIDDIQPYEYKGNINLLDAGNYKAELKKQKHFGDSNQNRTPSVITQKNDADPKSGYLSDTKSATESHITHRLSRKKGPSIA